MAKFAKFIVALFGGIATWGVTAGADGSISDIEYYGLLAVIGTAFEVFAIANVAINKNDNTATPVTSITSSMTNPHSTS